MEPHKNTLAAKVSRSKVSPDELAQRFASADAGIEAGADGFVAWAAADVLKAQSELDKFEIGTGDDAVLKEIFRIVHDLKGQGGTFGFALVTSICAPLADFLREGSTVPSASHIAVIKAHLTALNAVLTKNIKGDGGEMGGRLLEKLAAVLAGVPPLK